MPGKPLKSQAQEMVLNLLEYFENEKRNGGPLIPVEDVQQRVADALKISKRTVYTCIFCGIHNKEKEGKYGIVYNEKMTVAELLLLAKQHKRDDPYVLDQLLRAHGHAVLRLPPYHCDFNAIELIWAKSKAYYNYNIGRDGYGDEKVISMWKEALESCSEVVWENCVRHTEKIIKEWYDREKILLEIDVEPLIMAVDADSPSESELTSGEDVHSVFNQ